MEKIISTFSTLFVLLLVILGSAALITVGADVAAAKEYKADVIAEIENSNFNPHVIDQCISQAQAAGYRLQVVGTDYDADHNVQTAEVILSYDYNISVFGISKTHETRGVAR